MKVLHLITRADTGGITTWLCNYYSHMDTSTIAFDVVAIDTGYEHSSHKLMESLGMKVFYMPSSLPQRLAFLYKLFKSKKYDIVHSHSQLPSAIYLLLANIMGIRVRIAHSHLSIYDRGLKNKILRFILNRNVTHRLGASESAIQSLFGSLEYKNTYVINNAIEAEKYIFNMDVRESKRKELTLEKQLVLGFLGRLTYLKNVFFLLEILQEVKSKSNNCRLLVVGDGELRESFEEKAQEMGLSNHLIMVGHQSDIPSYLMAMDVFLAPSFSEGFSIVLLEAQATSLFSIAAKNRIPESVNITEYLSFLPIENGPEDWANLIMEKGLNYIRRNTLMDIQDAQFDIGTEAIKLYYYYKDWSQN